MKKLFLIIIIVAVIAVIAFILLPFVSTYYFWFLPLQEKRQTQLNYQNLCQQWNSTGCNGNPSDELCKAAAGQFATTIYPLNATKCSDVSSQGLQLLKQACCGK